VAADVIDESNMVRWLRVFKRYARGARLWGLHNYKDTNPRRGQKRGGTRKLLRAVRGRVWLTETGGIVFFRLPSGGVLFPDSESRASRALGTMFRLAQRYRRRIKRVYIYDWSQSAPGNRFDSGLVRRNGSTRPGYDTVRRNLATASFSP
jgi:polysaccharide biosynthesis protein PslG